MRCVSQGHSRHGGAGRRVARAGRQRQQLEPALDGTVRPADQPVDHVDADADAPQLGGCRAAVLLQHGRQADDRGRGGRGERRARRDGRPVRGRFGRRVRHPLAVQVDGHVRMIAVVDLQRLAVEQYRTLSLVAQLVTRHGGGGPSEEKTRRRAHRTRTPPCSPGPKSCRSQRQHAEPVATRLAYVDISPPPPPRNGKRCRYDAVCDGKLSVAGARQSVRRRFDWPPLLSLSPRLAVPIRVLPAVATIVLFPLSRPDET